MVTLVATVGNRSLDLYSQKLAQNLHVAKIYSDIYERNVRLFNVPIFCRQAVKVAWGDWRFIRMLNRRGGVVHLPNHHLGRYGLFLKIPYIITVHDLIRYFDLKGYGTYIHRPNLRDRFYLSMDYRGIKKAARIIAISETTKRDLIQHLRDLADAIEEHTKPKDLQRTLGARWSRQPDHTEPTEKERRLGIVASGDLDSEIPF